MFSYDDELIEENTDEEVEASQDMSETDSAEDTPAKDSEVVEKDEMVEELEDDSDDNDENAETETEEDIAEEESAELIEAEDTAETEEVNSEKEAEEAEETPPVEMEVDADPSPEPEEVDENTEDPTPELETVAENTDASVEEAEETSEPKMDAEEETTPEPELPPIVKSKVEPAPAAEVNAMSVPIETLGSEENDGREWYVVHCYSGYENKVRHNLEQRIESMGMKGYIYDVVVPTEEEIEVKDGKRRTVERRVFPGYILVNMLLTEESWYVVRNTPGVTSFVGQGNDPIPLRPEEVAKIIKRMEADAPRVKLTYSQGERVRIIDGPFNDFRGTVDEIDMERAKVRVMVNFFGRETPVELDFLQVEKS